MFACLLFKHLSKYSKKKKLNSVQNMYDLCIEPDVRAVFFFARGEPLVCEYVQVSRMLAEVK